MDSFVAALSDSKLPHANIEGEEAGIHGNSEVLFELSHVLDSQCADSVVDFFVCPRAHENKLSSRKQTVVERW